MADYDRIVDGLLTSCGRTYAAETGIRRADTPGPLSQLQVLATLLSARISAGIALAAARELFAAGYRSPAAMTRASWPDRVDAIDRGHYRCYDESTATMLGDAAALLTERWHGDLRRLRDGAGGDPDQIAGLLTDFPGIGQFGPVSSCARYRKPGRRWHRTPTARSRPARAGSDCPRAAMT